MGDHSIVCCMCGDVGFPDKLFRCNRCLSRFQHPYCSNYYEEDSSIGPGGVCDWCRSEERSAGVRHGFPSKKPHMGKEAAATETRSEYASRERIKQEDGGSGRAAKSASGSSTPSSKSGGRRYKLLKDVLC